MKTVYKYNPEINSETILNMPIGAKIIFVGCQHSLLTMWALVDPSKETESRKFYIRGTGHPVESNLSHIGSAICDPFVWHVFEQAA